MKIYSTRLMRIGTLATALAVTSLGAQATDNGNRVDKGVTVRYGDLDIQSPAGARELRSRILRAAERVCDNGTRDLRQLSEYQRCIADTSRLTEERIRSNDAESLRQPDIAPIVIEAPVIDYLGPPFR